jgi:hypothetical protein
MNEHSIFRDYYTVTPFYDRFANHPHNAVTVVIPTVHTNELWESNLNSIYREIPVKQLLIGDGGCIDDSIAVAMKFPRVVVHDHRSFMSLGFSIRKLIEAVETEWFVYLHSDVYLPAGWFDAMSAQQDKYDWFGCRMRQTIMVEFDNDYGERPYAGSQMGRREAFSKGLKRIDDDFVYRQEDFVFSNIVLQGGFREGKVDDVFHYHQTIKKPSPFWNPLNVRVSISQTLSHEEEVRVWDTQFRGIIKYLIPSSEWVIREAGHSAIMLMKLRVMSADGIYAWVSETNPSWLPFVKRALNRHRLMTCVSKFGVRIKQLFRPFLRRWL